MKFDVVVGNPPYQDESGRASIYDKFIDVATKLGDEVAMITRDNWLSGKDFVKTRNNLIENGSIMEIVHYPKICEVFANVQVAVTYFRWKKGIKQDTKYTRIIDGKATKPKYLNISDGLIFKNNIGESIINKVGGLSDWSKQFHPRGYAFMDQRKYNRLRDEYSSIVKSEYYNVEIISNDDYTINIFVNIANFNNRNEIERYKVQCGVIVNEALENKPGNVLTNIIHLPPNTIGSYTWALVATFETERESINCEKYIKTKFVRFLANQTVDNRSNVTDNTFKFVPLQDFTSNSDIDWYLSVASINQQLYKKYNLTPEEIDYIEQTIKPME